MSSLTVTRAVAAAARLRGVDVIVHVEFDMHELEMREASGLSLKGLSHTHLAALLTIPRWEHVPMTSLPAAGQRIALGRPDLVEHDERGFVARRVGPPLWVEMVTLPVRRWRVGLRAVGRFAPYSARRIRLAREPADVGDLSVQATYWGVGVQVVRADGLADLVLPEPFRPQRYTGASWAFAEETLQAVSPNGPALMC